MSLFAETTAILPDRDAAIVLYRSLKPWVGLNAADHPDGVRGSISRYLGLLGGPLKRLDEAAVHYEAALEINTDMRTRPWLAHTQNDYAQMLLSRGSAGGRDRADQLREAARTTCDELGMSLSAATIITAERKNHST
jgi:hypothetical protein